MADSDSILQLGIEAARAGDKAEARELFRLVTRENPSNAQGWLWLAGVAENRDEKRAALERVVTIEPSNDLARKGLAAIGGAPAGSTPPLAHQAVPMATPAASTPDVPVDSPDAGIAGTSTGARQYDVPDNAAPPAVTVDGWTTPTYDAEEFDLQDYQQQSQTQSPPVAIAQQPAPETRIVVEDEEPAAGRRMMWLPIAAVVVIVLIAAFWWGNRPASNGVQGVTDGTLQPTSAPSGSDSGALPITELPATTAEPVSEPAAPPISVSGAEATAPPAEATAPPADVAAPPAETVPASEETIVVVAPGATVEPTPEAAAVETPPAEQPPAAPPAPPSDIAAANPAIVPLETVVEAGNWTFSYGGIQNITDRAYAGSPPSRGQYQIVLMAVGNRGAGPASVPDGFFVLKDAQGRVYDFNRAASIEYFIGAGGAGVAADIGPDAEVPNNNVLTSVPLLFDVPPDAANLVLLSRDNLNQGFVIR